MKVKSFLRRKVIKAFDKWSDRYESDVRRMIEKRGYSYSSLAKEILTFLQLQPDALILEVGTGPGTLGLEVATQSDASLVGIDVSGKMTARARERGTYISLCRASIENLPFEDKSFNGAYASFVIHSVLDQRRALRQVYRVLKNGASFVFVDLCPIRRPLWIAVFLGLGHSVRREFGAPAFYAPVEHYVQLALEVGFIITAVKPIGKQERYTHFLIAMKKNENGGG